MPVEDTNTQPLKQPTLPDLVNQISQKLEAGNFPNDYPVTIKIGTQKVYQGIPGQEPIVAKITSNQVAFVQKAIEGSEQIKNAISISVGDEKVFHSVSGEIKVNRLSSAVPEQARKQEVQQQVTPPAPSPNLQEQIATLQAAVQRQQAIIEQQQKQLNLLQESPFTKASRLVKTGSERLDKWLNNINTEIKTAAKEAIAQVSSQMEKGQVFVVDSANELANKTQQFARETQVKVADNLRSARGNFQQFARETQDKAIDTVQSTRDNIRNQVDNFTVGATNAVVGGVVNRVGQELPDGTKVVESRNLNQRLEVHEGKVSLSQRPSLNHQALWNEYAFKDVEKPEQFVKLQQDFPVSASRAVAQVALKSGESVENVKDILLYADPQVKKVMQQQGVGVAQKYVAQVTRSAVELNKSYKSLNQQQQRRSQNNNLGQ